MTTRFTSDSSRKLWAEMPPEKRAARIAKVAAKLKGRFPKGVAEKAWRANTGRKWDRDTVERRSAPLRGRSMQTFGSSEGFQGALLRD
jgi:hypothetical protein